MQKNAIIKEKTKEIHNGSEVYTAEIISSLECAGCTENCKKVRPIVKVTNTKNLALTNGSLVILSLSKIQEALESIISLGIPILSAFAGFIFSNPIFRFFYSLIKKGSTQGTACPESIKALITLVFFAFAAFLVLKITHSKRRFFYMEITDVLERAH